MHRPLDHILHQLVQQGFRAAKGAALLEKEVDQVGGILHVGGQGVRKGAGYGAEGVGLCFFQD